MWDDRIDEVARALTNAPAPAHLTARVLAAIREDARPTRRWHRWWTLSPVAVATTIAIAVVLRGAWTAPPRQAPQPPMGRDIALPSAPPLHVDAGAPAAAGANARGTSAAPRRGPGNGAVVVRIQKLMMERLPVERTLVSLMPLPETIELKGLELAPLGMAPLTPEERQPPQ